MEFITKSPFLDLIEPHQRDLRCIGRLAVARANLLHRAADDQSAGTYWPQTAKRCGQGGNLQQTSDLVQYTDFRRTDHPGRTAPATVRYSFYVVWGLSDRSHREKGHFLFVGLSPLRFFLHLPAPHILEHLNRCRGIPGVVIVGIGVDLDLPLVDLPEDFRPFR